VPDYVLLHRIGSGAYGEVWLARSVTGALRAIKVVWRTDFPSDRLFERELEGIRAFEPLSREHPGLVDILHVGRQAEAGFYYCVMELADDASGRPAHASASYRPRTLTSDLETFGRIDLPYATRCGASLADALSFVHQHGLAHRDVKPSNVIFVAGVPKLADVGLVASAGQMLHVGTEGYVPPEGAGTASADVFALGKVLYEMTTGRDRLDFPSIPDSFAAHELALWRKLNRVLLRACTPDPRHRTSSASILARSLRSALVSSSPWHHARRAAALLLGSALLAGLLHIDRSGQALAIAIPPIPPSQPSLFSDSNSPRAAPVDLLPPRQGQPWTNSLSIRLLPVDDHSHRSPAAVSMADFERFLRDTGRPFEGEVIAGPAQQALPDPQPLPLAAVPLPDAQAFCDWLLRRDRDREILGRDHRYRPAPLDPDSPIAGGDSTLTSAFGLELIRLRFGAVTVTSNPPGALVLYDGEVLGETPLTMDRMPAGVLRLDLWHRGYRKAKLGGIVAENTILALHDSLEPSARVAFGRPWSNTLDMPLVPVGHIMMAAHETRLADYEAFVASSGRAPTHRPSQHLGGDHPVVGVNRDDADAFCDWLTAHEREAGAIGPDHHYRLPTDHEWSIAAGLPMERGQDPARRHLRARGIYPWGYQWPPPPLSVNLADESARDANPEAQIVEGYRDNFPGPAPVGSFPANPYGLHDLAGNVWEWVSDPFGGPSPTLGDLGVVRGGSWDTHQPDHFLSSYRNAIPARLREPIYGFRVVLSELGDTLDNGQQGRTVSQSSR